jgi:ketosteroid isomerase-like protein
MNRLTEDDVREIQQIHSSWIEFEIAGEDRRLLPMCADDIEFWPPDAPPVLGRTAVLAQLARGSTRIHGIEISDRRIRGSNEIAYLTSSYKTTFSSAEDSTPRQALGRHLWILEKRAGTWVVTLVSWSLWAPPFPGLVSRLRSPRRRVHILKNASAVSDAFDSRCDG